MDAQHILCSHACRNTCAMLQEALKDEAAMVRFYTALKQKCDYPDVHDMIQQLIEERSKSVLVINQKLNELRARAGVLDGIMSSFDPAGC